MVPWRACTLAALALSSPSVADSTSLQPQCLQAPVTAVVVRPFEEPDCPYCSGHRTIDFAARPGSDVRAPITGTVTFVGTVAGSRYVTITARSGTASPGFLVTVGGVHPTMRMGVDSNVDAGSSPGIASGDEVRAGQIIGSAADDPIRLSLRRIVTGGPADYLDPEASLVRWRGPVRLVLQPNLGGESRRVTPRWSCRRPI